MKMRKHEYWKPSDDYTGDLAQEKLKGICPCCRSLFDM